MVTDSWQQSKRRKKSHSQMPKSRRPRFIWMNEADTAAGETAGSPPPPLVGTCRKPVRTGFLGERIFHIGNAMKAPRQKSAGFRHDPEMPALRLYGVGPAFRQGRAQVGPVAQLDRASDFYSEGCRFESCRDRQYFYRWNKRFSKFLLRSIDLFVLRAAFTKYQQFQGFSKGYKLLRATPTQHGKSVFVLLNVAHVEQDSLQRRRRVYSSTAGMPIDIARIVLLGGATAD